jgi:hypothetical protein
MRTDRSSEGRKPGRKSKMYNDICVLSVSALRCEKERKKEKKKMKRQEKNRK